MFGFGRLMVVLAVVLAPVALTTGCGGGDDIATPDGSALPDGAPPMIDAAPIDAAPPADADTRDILERLQAIPGLTVTEQDTMIAGYRFFFLTFDQPADHADPGGVHFQQRLTLLHTDENAPFVMYSSGYNVSLQDRRTELTKLIGGNQLALEHRFFEPSRPSPADWSLDTIAQAAADYHAIAVALKPIYQGRWVATGASKGGMTSVFYRRFYPDDVDATVAYVAPISFAAPDNRYGPFIEAAGTDPACRQALYDFQRAALLQRLELETIASDAATMTGDTYDLLGIDRALEHAVLELPFAFWQYFDMSFCAMIPPGGATASENYPFLDLISGMANFADATVTYYAPYYYQAGTELGYPGIPEAQVADLIVYPGTDIPATYSPPGVPVVFDPAAMNDVASWVDTEGTRLMFIYGENDPWSAGMYDLGNATDSALYIVPAGNHGSRILQLPEPERTQALDKLSVWMNVPITLPALVPDEPIDRTAPM